MIKPITILTTILFVFLSSLTYAQNKDFEAGYIIKESDTIPGYILRESESKLSKGITFKKSTDSERLVYTANDLKGFSFSEDSLHFEAIDYAPSLQDSTRQKRFAKILLKSNTDLFKLQLDELELTPIYMQDNNFVLVLKKDKQFITLGQYESIVENRYQLKKKYIGILRALLSDCPKSANFDFDNLPFEEDKIIKLVSEYNACNGNASTTQTYVHTVKAIKRVGAELSFGGIFPAGNNFIKNGRNIGLGYFRDVFKKDNSRNASFTIGVKYMYVQYDYLTFISYNKISYEKLREHYLLVPFHHQINLRNYRYKKIPFVFGGLAASFGTNSGFNYLDILPFIELGAGAYINRIKISATFANAGLSLRSEKLVNLGIGWRFR